MAEITRLPGQLEPGSRRERRVIGFALATAGVVLILDQLTKAAVERSFVLGESHPVVNGYLSMTYVLNRGAAWSLFQNQTWFLLGVAALVTAGCFFFFRYLTEGWSERYYSIFIILGGVAGNSIDRIWRGAVVDFIDAHYQEVARWPVFNVADIAICVGVGLFILSNLLRKSARDSKPVAS